MNGLGCSSLELMMKQFNLPKIRLFHPSVHKYHDKQLMFSTQCCVVLYLLTQFSSVLIECGMIQDKSLFVNKYSECVASGKVPFGVLHVTGWEHANVSWSHLEHGYKMQSQYHRLTDDSTVLPALARIHIRLCCSLIRHIGYL